MIVIVGVVADGLINTLTAHSTFFRIQLLVLQAHRAISKLCNIELK